MRGVIGYLGLAAGIAALVAFTRPATAQDWGNGRVEIEPSGANCFIVSFTRSASTKAESQKISRTGLKTQIVDLIRQQGWRRSQVKIRAKRAKPNPSLRDSVPASEFFRPDIVTARDYTQCWEGLFAPAICTAGALVCK